MPIEGEDNIGNDTNKAIDGHIRIENDEAFKDMPSLLQRTDEDSDSDSDSEEEEKKIHKQKRPPSTNTCVTNDPPPLRKAPRNIQTKTRQMKSTDTFSDEEFSDDDLLNEKVPDK